MPKLKIRQGDTVEVLTGRERDRGKRGTVLEVRVDEGRVIVEGRNLVKKHERARPVKGTRGAQMTPGGIMETEAPIQVSNVGLVCPKCDKVTRVSYTFLPDGTKRRTCRHCGDQVDQ
jgi:large subunit ribosomal protein L24